MTKPISVIGAGAWGTALAQILSVGGKNVTLWARESELVDDLNAKRENTMFLPGVPLSEDMKFSNNLAETCLLYTSPSPRDRQKSRMPSSA